MLKLCEEVASCSPDTRKVGCVVCSPSGEVLVTACNTLVHGVQLKAERLEKPAKYDWIEHAERNAVYKAASAGIPLTGTTMYLNWSPCHRCMRAVIASGVSRIVSSRGADVHHHRWGQSFQVAQQMCKESGVQQELIHLN